MTAPVLTQTLGLVEDSEEDFASFARILRREAPQMELRRWSRAEDVLEALADTSRRAEWPQVLVVDLSLPGIDGCELVRRLRANPATVAVPAFILSGSDRQSDIDRCYAAGANAYLTKPGNVSELRALLQMLLRSIASFKAPTPVGSVAPAEPLGPRPEPAPEIEPTAPVVDQASIDRHREDYERRLIEERDAERRGRKRAEALQRLTARLANATTPDDVDEELIRALTSGPGGRSARVERANGDARPETLFMPDPFGAGTIAILPIVGERGEVHGTLRVDTPSDIDEDEEAYLHAAVSLAGQAIGRVSRNALSAPAAGAQTGAADLPSLDWWRAAVEEEFARCLRSGAALTLVAVELADLAGYTTVHGHVAADALLLALGDHWRSAGHDLVAPFGDERFAALLASQSGAEAMQLADHLTQTFDADHGFVVGVAQWNRREDAAQLLGRAQADLAARRRRG